ncbi:molybdate ABC transporter substrate-binding protein [Alteribacillus sp. JSM 102045]|uniref:molybdate ABC transporter substrate-binding protein n=1 Tax=Alteribacillus sp. JSM 102045 TaxID=1562101 RepID=UPI0035C14770
MKAGYCALLLGTISFLSACSSFPAQQNDESSSAEELHVAAASDLYHAFTELGKGFEEETGIEVTFSFGSTGQITQQIEQGASSYDVFAAAHESYIDRLIKSGVMDKDTKERYALGRIGLMYDSGTYETVTPKDLTEKNIERIAIANPDHAPYGKAAKEALKTWGIWDEVEEKLVIGENIRQTLQYVESGNVEVGIVAVALSKQSSLSFEPIHSEDHEPLLQALGVPNRSGQKEEAKWFIDYMFSDEGQAIMNNYGFSLPEEE